jgi:putative component of membrane protein insertase Oxa1/YidC/SpoIIIJ protein YidD
MKILTNAAVNTINWYQSDISPKKGFCCAYRIKHGGLSCSAVIKKAFVTRGFTYGVYSVFTQARKCHTAAMSLSEQKNKPSSEDNENAKSCAKSAALEGAGWCCFMPLFF